MAVWQISEHSGHPEVASQYVGHSWTWTTGETDIEVILASFEKDWRDYELDLGDAGKRDVTTPVFDRIVDWDMHGTLDATWVCSEDDHDSEGCRCWVHMWSVTRDDDDGELADMFGELADAVLADARYEGSDAQMRDLLGYARGEREG